MKHTGRRRKMDDWFFFLKEIECKVIKLTDICSANQFIRLLETRCDEDGSLELRQMYTIAPPWAFTTNMIIFVQIKIRTSAFQTGGDINTHMLPYNPLSPFSTKFRNVRIQEHLLHFIIIISMWSEMTFIKSTKNKTIC